MSDGYVPPIHLGYSTDPSILMQQSKLANRTASPAVIILLTVVIIMYYIVFYVFLLFRFFFLSLLFGPMSPCCVIR